RASGSSAPEARGGRARSAPRRRWRPRPVPSRSAQRSRRSRRLLPSPGHAPALYRHQPTDELGGWWRPVSRCCGVYYSDGSNGPTLKSAVSLLSSQLVEANRVREGGAMSDRSGPFWDVVEGRASSPPAAGTLGLEFIDADGNAGAVDSRSREAMTSATPRAPSPCNPEEVSWSAQRAPPAPPPPPTP